MTNEMRKLMEAAEAMAGTRPGPSFEEIINHEIVGNYYSDEKLFKMVDAFILDPSNPMEEKLKLLDFSMVEIMGIDDQPDATAKDLRQYIEEFHDDNVEKFVPELGSDFEHPQEDLEEGDLPKVDITSSNGQTVSCYGRWREDSNAECAFDDEEFDGIYADGGRSWKDVVEKLTKYAERNGTELVQLVAC